MGKKSKDFLILILFYVNLVVYVGGDVYWRLWHHQPLWAASTTNQLSNYDRLIQKYSQRHGLDWRFVSSMIKNESSFQNDAISSAGAIGLMQILPAVAEMEGVTDMTDPEENIRAGVKHFKRYFGILKGETLEDTLKINLAAYNAGIAHINDAKKLALYFNMNPRQWKSLEITLPLLETEEFQPFINHGYCQGNSVVSYVKKVFKTYQNYRIAHPDFPLETTEL